MISATTHDREQVIPTSAPTEAEGEEVSEGGGDVRELYELANEGWFSDENEFVEFAKTATDEDLFEVFEEGSFENVEDLKGYLKKKDDTGEDTGEEGDMESTYVSEDSESLLGSGQNTDKISDDNAADIFAAFEKFDGAEIDPIDSQSKKLGFNFQDNLNSDQKEKLRIFMEKEKAKKEEEKLKNREEARQTPSKQNPIETLLNNPDEQIQLMDKRYGENWEMDINKDGVIDKNDSELYNKSGGYTQQQLLSGKIVKDQVREFTEAEGVDLYAQNTKRLVEDAQDRQLEQKKLAQDKIDSEGKPMTNEEIDQQKLYQEKVETIETLQDNNMEELAKYINTNFGRNGFFAYEVENDSFILSDADGNPINVNEDTNLNDIKSFLNQNASSAETDFGDINHISTAEKKAVEWFADKGLNYYGVNAAVDNYDALVDKATLIENLIENPTEAYIELTPEFKAQEEYKDLFFKNRNGVLVPHNVGKLQEKLAEIEGGIAKLSEVVGYNWNDQQIKDATEAFDLYMDNESKKVQKEASVINHNAQTWSEDLEKNIQSYFGKSWNDITKEDIKTEADVRAYNTFLDQGLAVQFSQADAGEKYLDAATFFNTKFDKQISSKSKDNWAGIYSEIRGGIDRSQGGDLLMQYAMGMTPDGKKSRDEVAYEIASQMRQAEKRGGSSALHKFMKARGAGETAAVIFNDPGELAAAAVASSLSQLLVYGTKITATAGAAGFLSGLGYGAVAGTAAGPAGTVAGAVGGGVVGGIWGLRTGMAVSMFAMEYNNAVLDAARHYNYDPLNGEQFSKAMDDERVWDRGMEIGLKRGIPIAVIDFISAGLAGKTFGTAKRAFSSPLKRTAMIAAEHGIYGPGAEMIGEAAAMFSAGQKLDAKEILLEGIGGFGNNSINLAYETAMVTSKNAKINLAEELTDINKVMKESASDKTIMKFANDMRRTGQIDEKTYKQIEENISAKRTAEEYIKTGNPELIVQEDQVQAKEKAEQETQADTPAAVETQVEEGAIEEDTSTSTEQQQESDLEVAEEGEQHSTVAAKKGIFDSIFNRKRVNKIKNRVAELVKARNYYSTDSDTKTIFGKQISAINKEINDIVTTGKLSEKPAKLPQFGQVYKVQGRFGRMKNYNQNQFKKYLNSVSDEKFDKDKIIVKNPATEIQAMLEERNQKTEANAIQESSTEGVDVQQQSTDGEAMGKGNTQKQATQESQEEVQVEETQEKEVVIKGDKVKSNQSMTVTYNRNPEKSPDMGKKFGQDVEPAGTYVTQKEGFTPEGHESGKISIKNPLVIDITDETQISYKRDLSKKYKGKKGKALTNALKKEGYDAIVTKREDGTTGEIVLLNEKSTYEVKEVKAPPKKKTKSEVEADTSAENEAEILAKKLGLSYKKEKGETKFALVDETEQIDNETDIQAIADLMAEMDGTELDFTEDAIIEEGTKSVKVNPVQEHKNKEILIAKLKKLGYDPDKVMTTIEKWGGIPAVFGISDTLGAGKGVDAMGNEMDIDGGLFFNTMSPGNENKAWASVDKNDDINKTKEAIETYEKNKEFFDKWWKANPQYEGHVPLFITRMGDDAIFSNEAVFRFFNPLVKSLPLKNRQNALKMLVAQLSGKRSKLGRDQGSKVRVFETDNNKTITVKADNDFNAWVQADKIAEKRGVKIKEKPPLAVKNNLKESKGLLKFIEDNNITTLDEMFDAIVKDSRLRAEKGNKNDTETLGLNFKTRLFNTIFSSDSSNKTAGKPVILQLVKGLDESQQKELRQKFSTKNMYDGIAEPSVKESTQGSVIGVMGIEVAQPDGKGGWNVNVAEDIVSKTSHPNYATGPKGKLLAYITNPKHLANILPEMRAKLARLFKVGGNKDMSSKEKIKRVAKQTATSSTSTFMGDISFSGAKLSKDGVSDMEMMVGALKNTFPSMNVVTTQKEFDQRIKKKDVRSKISDGKKILGFVTNEGKIFLNPNKATFKTAIHEFGHVWVDYLKSTASGKNGTQMIKKGFELMDNPKLEVYQKALKKYGKYDSEGNLTNKELVLEEALVDAIANKGDNIKQAAPRAGFKSWLNGMYKFLKENFKLSKNLTPDEISNLDLEKFLGHAMADLVVDTGTSKKKRFTTSELEFDVAFETKDENTRMEIVGGMSANEIINEGRKEGFTEASIKKLVKAQFPELSMKIIDEKMNTTGVHGQIKLFTQQTPPPSFGNIDGGLQAGQKLYDDISRQLKKFSQEGSKTPIQMRSKLQQLLKAHPLYKNMKGNTTLQKEMLVELDALMDISEGKSLTETFKKLRKQINQRKQGAAARTAAIKRVESMLRQKLPKTALASSEVRAVMRMLKNAKPEEFDAAMIEAENLVAKVEGRLKTSLLKKALTNFKKLASTRVDSSGKVKSKGRVDADAISFFKQAHKVLQAYITNDQVAKQKLEDKLFLSPEQGGGIRPELETAINNLEQGNDLTVDERTLVNLYGAYETIKNIDKLSLDETKALLDKYSSIEKASKQSLAGKLLERAKENRVLKEEASEEIESSYGDTVFTDNETFTKATSEEEFTYFDDVLATYESSPNSESIAPQGTEIEYDGKTFQLNHTINKDGSVNYELSVARPVLKTENQMGKEFPSLHKRIMQEKGKGNKYARIKATYDHGMAMFGKMRKNPAMMVLEAAKNRVANIGTLMRLMDTTKNRFFENKVYRNLNRMFDAALGGYHTQVDHMNEVANEIFGFDKGMEGIQELDNVKDLHTLDMANGKTLDLFGPAIMRIYALSKNPTQRRKMLENNLGDFKFTEKTFEQIEEILDPKVKEFVDRTVEYLSDSYFESVNNIYEDINFVSLDKQENYFPTKTDTTNSQRANINKAILDGDFAKAFSAQYASGLKQRTDQSGEVKILGRDGKEIGFFGELNSHFKDMEKFKAYAAGVKEINTIFSDKAVNAALKLSGTDVLLNQLMNYAVNPNAVNELTFTKSWERKLFSYYSLAALGFKPIQALKQASSMFAAFTDYKYNKDGKSGTAKDALMFAFDLAKVMNPFTIVKTINKFKDISPGFRARLETKDIAALEGFMANEFSGKTMKRAQEWGGFFTRLGDTLGVLGYAANYNRDIANGMSKAKALEKFNDYNETQQSRRPQDMNMMQASKNILMRGVTMFASTAFLQMNQMIQSMNEIMVKTDGKIWKAPNKDWRKFFIQGSIVNSAFFMAGNFLRIGFGDEEDSEEALHELVTRYVLPVQMMETAFPLIGTSIGYLADIAGGLSPYEASKKRRNVISPLFDKISRIVRQTNKGEYKNAVGNALGLGLGMNTDPFLGMWDYFKDDEYNERDLARIFGIGVSATPDSIDEKGVERILNSEGYYEEQRIKDSDVYKANKQIQADFKKMKKDTQRKILESKGVSSY